MFDDIIADMESNQRLSSIVTELFLRKRIVDISFVFIPQSSFKVPKTVRLNVTHCFKTKNPNERKLQKIASNYSPDIDFKDFMKRYKYYTKEPYSLLVNDTTLSSNSWLWFTKNLS